MSLENENRDILIKRRLEQAHESIKAAEVLFENDLYNAAVSRIYYGIFYSLMALALKYKFKTSKHKQLIGWFNKEFIHSEKIEQEYKDIVNKAYDYRIRGDYDAFIEFDDVSAQAIFEDMKKFIRRIEEYLEKE